MPPAIPSPTPITGVQSNDGKPGLRLPIQELQQKHEFAFALYVQALAAWQKAGNETVDKDNSNGTGYFQVTGVHGIPYVPWQQDPAAVAIPNIGYCTHRSVLFIPWHRPYLMLYEQIIYAYAQEIAKEAKGYAADAYAAALKNVRLPYWDWASDPHLPAVVMQRGITLSVPGETPGTKKALHLQNNPLYSYRFTSDYAINLLQEELNWDHNTAWEESKRCPDPNGASNNKIANEQMGTFREFKWQTFELLTTVSSFDEFTCQAWKNGLAPPSFNSIESMHNNVHNYTGTNDTVLNDPNTNRLGNMTDVQSSSFDPIFWLHHTNCDRLTAIWQALNPNVAIETIPSLTPRYNAPVGTLESGASALEPWHKTDAHNMKDYFIADDTKDVGSTIEGGYYYPETPLDLFNDPEKLKSFTMGQVYALYAPSRSSLRKETPRSITNRTEAAVQKPDDEKKSPERHHTILVSDRNELADVSVQHWQVFLRVRNFALTGTWAVHIFFGEPPAATVDWFLSDARVGSVTMLSNRSRENCPNCKEQASNDILVTGSVPLNESLGEKGIDVNDTNAVVQYLKENLTWRVVKDTQNVEIVPELKLTVGVSAHEVTYPESTGDLPKWGECQIFPSATEGKAGGLTEANRADLGLQA